VKNANSTWLNDRPQLQDLQSALGRRVRVKNDANCFAVTEAFDGAGQGATVIAGVILGTGCGCGISINQEPLYGLQGIAEEFGHVPLPGLTPNKADRASCWCGRNVCLETFVSGPGFQRDYAWRSGDDTPLLAEEILALKTNCASAAYSAYCDRLALGLSLLVNILDPNVIVLGGGMSNIISLYDDVPELMKQHIFSDVFDTPIVQAVHGDSSGVLGASYD